MVKWNLISLSGRLFMHKCFRRLLIAQPLVIMLPSLKYAEANEDMVPLRPVVDVEAVSDKAADNADVVQMED